jgi:hypothetical protein
VSERERLLRRINAVLGQAEVLSETRAAGRLDRNRVSNSKQQSSAPRGDESTLDRLTRQLEAWCQEAEATVAGERRSALKPMTATQYSFWFFETYQGVHYRKVAEAENLPPTTVRTWRERNGRDPLYGRPKDQSPATKGAE